MSLSSAALNAQLDILRWMRTERVRGYCDNLLQPGDSKLSAMMIGILNRAETYAVTTEISEVLTQASATIPDYMLHDSDVPSAGGFVYLEEPQVFSESLVVQALAWYRVSFRDANDPDQSITAVPPGTAGDATGLVFILFTDPTDERDHLNSEWTEQDLAAFWRVASGHVPKLLPMWGGVWNFGEPPLYREVDLSAWMMAFFRFIQEPFIDMRMIIPDRATRRRYMRLGAPEPEVRVVQLRRKEQPRRLESDEPPNEQVWSHRWLVRGHWRNQWYPSQKRHAPRWIAPFIKGPEDRPLVLHDHVFEVKR